MNTLYLSNFHLSFIKYILILYKLIKFLPFFTNKIPSRQKRTDQKNQPSLRSYYIFIQENQNDQSYQQQYIQAQ